MMCHRWLLGDRIVSWQPKHAAAWTEMVGSYSSYDNADFAYSGGKMYCLESDYGVTNVFDAHTQKLLHRIGVPQPRPTSPVSSYVDFPRRNLDEFHYLNLVALPSKLILVRTSGTKSSELKGVDVFEVGSRSEDGEIAWRKVTCDNIGGNYDLFIDGHHATFSDNGTGSGTRMYCVLGRFEVPTTATYCYDMKDDKLECIYRSPANEFSTKPGWFLP